MPTTIRAALLTGPRQPLQLTDLVLDDPLDHEVAVRTERAGLCHSDLHYITGSLEIGLPAVLGHEVAGIVERVGAAVTRFVPGDRVVATLTPACGACRSCLRGRAPQCERVTQVRARPRPKVTTAQGASVQTLGSLGGFSTAFLATESSLAKVPGDVPPEVACLLGCAVTTGVGAVVHGAGVTPDDTVAVIGCGGIGISAIQGARLAGARRIVAIDALQGKLDAARRFGATDVVLAGPDPAETAAQVRGLLPDGVDHAIEAVGRRQTAELAFDLLATGGTATILGLMPEGERLNLSADALVYGDRRIQGAYMGGNRFISDVDMFVDHYRSGRLDLDAMVTAQLPIEQIDAGFALLADPETVRVVVSFNGS